MLYVHYRPGMPAQAQPGRNDPTATESEPHRMTATHAPRDDPLPHTDH